MFWASSYNLFVTWAANGQHPWDALPGSHAPAAILEIGALRGNANKVNTQGFILVKALSGYSGLCLCQACEDVSKGRCYRSFFCRVS
jgi:hypothetical protein